MWTSLFISVAVGAVQVQPLFSPRLPNCETYLDLDAAVIGRWDLRGPNSYGPTLIRLALAAVPQNHEHLLLFLSHHHELRANAPSRFEFGAPADISVRPYYRGLVDHGIVEMIGLRGTPAALNRHLPLFRGDEFAVLINPSVPAVIPSVELDELDRSANAEDLVRRLFFSAGASLLPRFRFGDEIVHPDDYALIVKAERIRRSEARVIADVVLRVATDHAQVDFRLEAPRREPHADEDVGRLRISARGLTRTALLTLLANHPLLHLTDAHR